MPQVFQQTLWVGSTGQQGEGQEIVRRDVERRTGLERARSFFVFSYVQTAGRKRNLPSAEKPDPKKQYFLDLKSNCWCRRLAKIVYVENLRHICVAGQKK
jgi:hypothetical protein